MVIRVVVLDGKDALDQKIQQMNKETAEWEMKAARGECGWVCSDCGCSFQSGMPDECAHGYERCTTIIQRDKRNAMRDGNEPS